jgi:hypothetical protein
MCIRKIVLYVVFGLIHANFRHIIKLFLPNIEKKLIPCSSHKYISTVSIIFSEIFYLEIYKTEILRRSDSVRVMRWSLY